MTMESFGKCEERGVLAFMYLNENQYKFRLKGRGVGEVGG